MFFVVMFFDISQYVANNLVFADIVPQLMFKVQIIRIGIMVKGMKLIIKHEELKAIINKNLPFINKNLPL